MGEGNGLAHCCCCLCRCCWLSLSLVFSCQCPWCCQIHHLGDVHHRIRAARITRLASSRYLHLALLALLWLSCDESGELVANWGEMRRPAGQRARQVQLHCSPKKYKRGVLLRWAAVMDTVRSGHWVGTHCYITFWQPLWVGDGS